MKRLYLFLGCLMVLVSVSLSSDDVFAKAIDYSPSEVQMTEINESLSENDMPVGGWSPMVEHKLEKDVIIEKSLISRSRNIFNSSLDNVFSKGAGTNGYNALSKANQKTLYLQMNTDAVNFMESATDLQSTRMTTQSGNADVYVVSQLNFQALGLTKDEALQVICAYDYDHPGYYWISNSYWSSNTSIYLCTEEEYASVSYRKSLNNKIITGVKEYIALTEQTEDIFEKISLIHDKIITDVDYAYEEDGTTPVSEKWAHSVQGVFDSDYSKAVCEGYADTFSLIMNYLDIPNYYIVGTAGNGGGHVWNAVSDDGGTSFMYMDLTWDDSVRNGFYHKYFGMPKSDFESSHYAYKSTNTGIYWLYDIDVELTDNIENSYYYKVGFYCSDSGNCKEFAKYIRTKAYRFGTIFSYLSDSSGVRGNVASELNLGAYSYYTVNYLNQEYYIVIISENTSVDISDAEITLAGNSYGYTGEEIQPEVEQVVLNGVKLIKDVNYTVSYENNIALGSNTARVIVEGMGRFAGECITTFSIEGYALDAKNVLLSVTEFTYDGSVKKPVITVTCGNDTLGENADYTVEYSDNTFNAGTVTVTIKGKGEYRGVIEKNYTILPKKVTVSGITAKDKIYDGTTDVELVYSGIDLISCGIIEGDDVGVEAEGSFADADACVDKTVTISNITLTGEDADNYKLSSIGQQEITYADINLKPVTITALDQSVYLNEDIDQDVSKAVLTGALEQHELTDIELISSGTGIITDRGSITPQNAVIMNGEDNVTSNYDIVYINGTLVVEQNVCTITYTWSNDGKTCAAKAVYSNGLIVEENVVVNGEVSKKATCKDKGVTTYTASFTNNIFTTQTKDVIDIAVLTTHTPASAVRENEVIATCESEGFYEEVVYCSVCGVEMSRNTVNVDAVGHDYKEIMGSAKAATCTQTGKEADKKCLVCGDLIKGKDIDALGHDWGEWTVKTPATETSEGVEERVCKNDPAHKETRKIVKVGTKSETDNKEKQDNQTTTTTSDEEAAKSLTEKKTPLTEKADSSTEDTTHSSGNTAASSQTADGTHVEQDANSQNESSNETFNLITSKNGETTLEYKSSSDEDVKTVIIPDTQTINGVTYKVTKLAAGAFADNKTIEKVVIGSNIESIGDNAFKGCTNLKSITIPERVKEIGDSAFEGCTTLNNVNLGSIVAEIGDRAFANCSKLTKVIIPAKVTKIGRNAFRNNKKLKTIIIKSKKLKSIGKNAFKNINKKATFYVPKKLTKKQLAKYKKMIKNSGVSKSVKIKKK